MSDTPRTDQKQGLYECSACGNHVISADFARTLERELAEARDLIFMKDQALKIGAMTMHENNKLMRVMIANLDEAKRERDNALSDWRQADADSIRAIHERNEARQSLNAAISLIADIRQAIGDPTGKLMQDEIVARCLDTSMHRIFLIATLREIILADSLNDARGIARAALEKVQS